MVFPYEIQIATNSIKAVPLPPCLEHHRCLAHCGFPGRIVGHSLDVERTGERQALLRIIADDVVLPRLLEARNGLKQALVVTLGRGVDLQNSARNDETEFFIKLIKLSTYRKWADYTEQKSFQPS